MSMKLVVAVTAFLVLGVGSAGAQECPPDCPVKGGGSPRTDCLLEFGGVTSSSTSSRVISCGDNDPSCDLDPTPGVCGFDVFACVNNADPSLPNCTLSGVEFIRARGGGEGGVALAAAISEIVPSNENTCTEPVRISVPVSAQAGAPLGRRRFQLNSLQSTFSVNGLPLGNFSGFVEFEVGAPDPATGLAFVDVVDASEYIRADIGFGGLTLCIKPTAPVAQAGVVYCGARQGGNVLRVNAYGPTGNDRDALLFACRPQVNYTTELTMDHDVGELEFGQLDEFSSQSGEFILAPIPPLAGFPVEIITVDLGQPCESASGGMSAAIALTTMKSSSRILNANGRPGQTLEFSLTGEPFDCEAFDEEGSGGVLVFTAPQLNLQPLGDSVTMFRFTDRQ